MLSDQVKNRAQLLIQFGYLGHRFHGVQPQIGFPTVGAALKARLHQAAGQPARALTFAARTDRGVHALHSVATCWFKELEEMPRFLADLAIHRDDGLLCVRAQRVPYHVHARGSSRGKTYRYVVEDGFHEGCPPNPLAWQITPPLEVAKMREGAAFLLGEHNFQSFRSGKCGAASPKKHIYEIDIHGPILLSNGRRQFHIDIRANAFLRQMIRIIVGLLLEVGTGLRQPEEVKRILLARNRLQAGITARPQGLCLMKVGFDLTALPTQSLH